MFSEYKRSVEARYPPVCADCAPAVEEEIRRRDTMARTRALGGFLGASNPQRHQVARTQRERDKLTRQIVFWKVRGVLWLAYLFCALGYYALGKYACLYCHRSDLSPLPVTFGHARYHLSDSIKPCLPILVLVSILWTAWDPTYGVLKRAEYQGRIVRQRGKREYNVSLSSNVLNPRSLISHPGSSDDRVAIQRRDFITVCPILVYARVGPTATMG